MVTDESRPTAERRWPMVAAVLVCIVLSVGRPDGIAPPAFRLFGVLELVLLVVLIVGDPGRIDRTAVWLKRLTLLLVAVLATDLLIGISRLVVRLIDGAPPANNATDLLLTATGQWIYLVIVFGLLFWVMDGGGAAERFHHPDGLRDFAFPGDISPETVPPGWQPRFSDYLYIGLTNAVAFSPTEAMPLTGRSKLTMAIQSLVSLIVLSLVIARAVNVLQ
jgi:hypothetical protein